VFMCPSEAYWKVWTLKRDLESKKGLKAIGRRPMGLSRAVGPAICDVDACDVQKINCPSRVLTGAETTENRLKPVPVKKRNVTV